MAIVKWETLRIPYNVILLLVGLAASWRLAFQHPGLASYIASALAYGAMANLCYCGGPLLETYLSVFTNIRVGKYRLALWGAGVVISVVLTIVVASVASFTLIGLQ